jgi:hypothetical protein
MTAALKRLVHVAARDLGLDADARHDVQLRVTGKASLSDMDAGELARLVDHFKALGFQAVPVGAKSRGRPAASRPDVRLCHVLWRLLADAGEAKVRGAQGLNAFIRARFGEAWGAAPIDVDVMRDGAQIAMVIEALKDWCRRAGIGVRS